jgi:hypothetical protein
MLSQPSKSTATSATPSFFLGITLRTDLAIIVRPPPQLWSHILILFPIPPLCYLWPLLRRCLDSSKRPPWLGQALTMPSRGQRDALEGPIKHKTICFMLQKDIQYIKSVGSAEVQVMHCYTNVRQVRYPDVLNHSPHSQQVSPLAF